MRKTVLLAASVVLAVVLASGLAPVPPENEEASAQTSPKPNIVFVLTDDNDARTYEDFMPRTNKLIGDAGVTFENATTPPTATASAAPAGPRSSVASTPTTPASTRTSRPTGASRRSTSSG